MYRGEIMKQLSICTNTHKKFDIENNFNTSEGEQLIQISVADNSGYMKAA